MSSLPEEWSHMGHFPSICISVRNIIKTKDWDMTHGHITLWWDFCKKTLPRRHSTAVKWFSITCRKKKVGQMMRLAWFPALSAEISPCTSKSRYTLNSNHLTVSSAVMFPRSWPLSFCWNTTMFGFALILICFTAPAKWQGWVFSEKQVFLVK